MAIIKMDTPFGEGNFITKQSLSNLEYNSIIDIPSDACVVIEEEGTERRRYELAKCAGNILNPKPKGIGNLFKKIDPNTYTVFFVSQANVEGKYGGNFDVKNSNIKELEYEKVFYQVVYQFRVNNSKRLLEYLVDENLTHYSREYFRKKIGKQMQITIEEISSRAISENGLSNFYTALTDIVKKIESKLNDDNDGFTWDSGIELKIIDLDVHEDEKIKAIKEDTEIRKYQKSMSIEKEEV